MVVVAMMVTVAIWIGTRHCDGDIDGAIAAGADPADRFEGIVETVGACALMQFRQFLASGSWSAHCNRKAGTSERTCQIRFNDTRHLTTRAQAPKPPALQTPKPSINIPTKLKVQMLP